MAKCTTSPRSCRKRAITLYAGKDASEEFNMLHAPNVLTKYLSPESCLGDVGSNSKM